MTQNQVTHSSLTVLSELFRDAGRHASEAMSRWTSGQITLSVEDVREVALETASRELNVGEELLTMVVLGIEGELGGQLILSFDEQNGRQLAASLLGREPETTAEWSELEQSALCETGNILVCAYVSALGRVLETDLVPTPPHFLQDYEASVLEQALSAQAIVSERVLVCRTRFQRAYMNTVEELDWNLCFVPTGSLLETLHETLCARV